MGAKPAKWDMETEVLVLGSGAAGLPAAIMAHDCGAKALVVEKSDQFGGTTACSGGGLWVPNSHHNIAKGVSDSKEKAFGYAKLLTKGRAADELIETYLDTAPEMLKYLEDNTPLKVEIGKMPDYHPEQPGGHDGENSRTVLPLLFNRNDLGESEHLLRRNPTMGIPMTNSEMNEWNAMGTPQNIDFELISKRMEEGLVGFGEALIGFLYRGCLDRSGMEFILNTRGRELILDQGRVVGLKAEQDGKDIYIKASKGVILATGGFEWDEELKAAFLPGPVTHPNSVPYNEGDGLRMAMAIGASIANMSEHWGWSSTRIPGEESMGQPLNRGILSERTLPHSIIVNKQGKRFCNEAASYNTMFKRLWDFNENTTEFPNLPAWLIFDQHYKDSYAMLTAMPGEDAPDWIEQASTLEELAKKLGIDPDGLAKHVKSFNELAEKGQDPNFQRGESVYDPLWGDWGHKPSTCLGTVEKPPFYAIPVYCGSLGTKGGPKTNSNGQVLDVFDNVIEGLYAAGNVMASVCGPAYWGGGATIGPAMTFGYICGRYAAKS
jgi:3-oxosteroid 1-dehydrogenase